MYDLMEPFRPAVELMLAEFLLEPEWEGLLEPESEFLLESESEGLWVSESWEVEWLGFG